MVLFLLKHKKNLSNILEPKIGNKLELIEILKKEKFTENFKLLDNAIFKIFEYELKLYRNLSFKLLFDNTS